MKSAPSFKAKKFKEAQKALDYVTRIYEANTAYLQESFEQFAQGKVKSDKTQFSACYPYIRLDVPVAGRRDERLSYGFVPRSGIYSTTLTDPHNFRNYYLTQFEHLLNNHQVPLEIGVSDTPIPVHFALGPDYHLEADLDAERLMRLPEFFDVPDLDIMDDEVANSTYIVGSEEDRPLSLFTAPRVDLSLQRLRHYTGTSAEHFQNYVIFTNYQFYIDQFCNICRATMSRAENALLNEERGIYTAFVEPGNVVTHNENYYGSEREASDKSFLLKRMPQMPAYHLKMPDRSGVTLVNIGVGPSNAKTITDHIAVLRPHAWIMLGHCAGLRNSQKLGDYVLAHGYLREDKILDEDLPISIPIPALAEIQQALEKAVATVTGSDGYDVKSIMRTGTVATTSDRNWELHATTRQNTRLSQSRAIAMDMESGTIAANGFRFRVPYGTLLCVSDKPLHGQLKLPGMADNFYRQRVEQHLDIGLMTMSLLRELKSEKLHSRKLRSFNEVAFQ